MEIYIYLLVGIFTRNVTRILHVNATQILNVCVQTDV